ncbi:MAG: LytR/AlgR family response regulator transcription factor, partial [Candidatus Cryptobacteroides sp.]
MNEVSGIELARQLPPGCCLIFTTAYAQYAIDGFDACAVDFLHKPFFYKRFSRAMQKAEQWLRMNDLLRMAEAGARQIVLKSEYKNVTVSMDTILYVESVGNYVKLHLTDGGSLLSKMSLGSIEEQLGGEEFLRIHRSFVVAFKRIEKFTRSEVVLSVGGKRLPIGRKYVDDVMARLKQL